MRIHAINSLDNTKFHTWKSLQTAKGIKAEGLCLVSGQKILAELKTADCLLATSAEALEAYASLCQTGFVLDSKLFRELDTFGTHGVLAVVPTPKIHGFDFASEPEGLEVVAPLSDPSNLGALIRSCGAFGVSKIILTTETANPFLPKSLRASSGLVLSARLYRGGALSDCKQGVGLDMDGLLMTEHKFSRNCRLVLGEEGQGLKKAFEGLHLKIPIDPSAESLNAMAAASIAMYEYRRQFPQ